MDKTFFHVKSFSVFLVLVFFSAGVFAAVEEVACNDYYHFDGLQFREFSPEKTEYIQGDDVKFNYVIENVFGSPLVQGDVKVLVMYEGPEVVNRMEDPDLLDDLFAKTDVNIQEGDRYAGSFAWKIPKKAKPGVYVAKVYFPVKKKLNIAGLTFMSSVPAKSTTFKVLGTDAGVFLLEKNRTSFNGQRYGFRDYIPGLKPGESAEVKTFLSNPNRESVTVVYELFYWDDTETRVDSYTKTETVTDSRELSYSLPVLPVGVYLARITASAGDWKSILKVRFYVEGAKAKFVWLGLDHFPLMQNDKSTIAFCLSNSAVKPRDEEIKLPVRISIEVLDESGGKVFEEEHQVENLTANIVGRRTGFVAPKQLTKLRLKGSIYGVNGELMDVIEIVYDYSKFLNIEKRFVLSAPDKAEDTLDYAVEYTDKYGDGVDGNVVIYLSAPDGKVSALHEANMSGKYSGEFSLSGMPEGLYTLKAVETKETLSDKKTVSVAKQASSTTVPETTWTTLEAAPPSEKKDDNKWLLLLVTGIAVIALVMLFLRSKPKKGGETKTKRSEKTLFTLLIAFFCMISVIGGAHALQVTSIYDPMDKSECTCSKYCDDSGDTKITRFTIRCWDYTAQITVPEDMKLVTNDKHVVGDQLCVGDKFAFQSSVSGGSYGGDGGEYWEDGGETDSPPVLWINDIEEAVREVLGCSNKKGAEYVTKFKNSLYSSSSSGSGSSGLCGGKDMGSSAMADIGKNMFMKCPGEDCFSGYNDEMPINDVGLLGGGQKIYKSLKGNIACRVEQKSISSGSAVLNGDYYEVTKKEDIDFTAEIEVQCLYYYEKSPSLGGVRSSTGLGLGVPTSFECSGLSSSRDASVAAQQVFYNNPAGMQSVCNSVKAKGFKVGSLKFEKNIKVVGKGNPKVEIDVLGSDDLKFNEANALKVLVKNTGDDDITVKGINSIVEHRFISCDKSPVKSGEEAECLLTVTPGVGQGLSISVDYEYLSCGRPTKGTVTKVLFESKTVYPVESSQVYSIDVHGDCENKYYGCSEPDNDGKFAAGYKCYNTGGQYYSPVRERFDLRFVLPDLTSKTVLGASLNLFATNANRAQEVKVFSGKVDWTPTSCSASGDICARPYCEQCAPLFDFAGGVEQSTQKIQDNTITFDISDLVKKAYSSGEKSLSLQLRGEEDVWNSGGKDSCGRLNDWIKQDVEFAGSEESKPYLEIVYK